MEEYLEAAEEVSGIDAEFDSIVSDGTLGSSVPAATRKTDYGISSTVDFVQNPYAFQQLDDGERMVATVHEILEEKQFNGFIGDTLSETHGISDEFRDFLNYAQVEFPNSIREGMTEALAETVVPDGEYHGRSFYPRETDVFKSVLEGMDFDLEEELLEDELETDEFDYGPSMESQAAENYLVEIVEIDYQEFADPVEGYSIEISYGKVPAHKIPEGYKDPENDYIEGADGLIGTQQPDTAQGELDPGGNSYSAPGV